MLASPLGLLPAKKALVERQGPTNWSIGKGDRLNRLLAFRTISRKLERKGGLIVHTAVNKYYDDFEQLTLTTRITGEKDGYYCFEETVFYGEKGGMLADKGTINGLEVTDLKWEGDTLYHQVAGQLTDPIMMQVDEKTRWLNTAVQSALHLLDTFYERHNLEIQAFGVNPGNFWYEVNQKNIDQAILDESDEFIRDLVRQNIRTRIEYIDGKDYPDEFYHEMNPLRLVHIGETNTQPCGTCHVNATGQIGSFVSFFAENSSKGSRVHFAVGLDAEVQLKAAYQQLKTMSQTLNKPVEGLAEAVKDLIQQGQADKKIIKSLKTDLLTYQAEELLSKGQKFIALKAEQAGDFGQLSALVAPKADRELILYVEKGTGVQFAIISPHKKAREIMKQLQEKNAAIKGGGPDQKVAGQAAIPIREWEGLLQELTMDE